MARILRIIGFTVLGLGLVLGFAAWQSPGDSWMKQASAANSETASTVAEMNTHADQAHYERIHIFLGDQDFNTYRVCHLSKPSTKAGQSTCDRLEQRVAKFNAEHR